MWECFESARPPAPCHTAGDESGKICCSQSVSVYSFFAPTAPPPSPDAPKHHRAELSGARGPVPSTSGTTAGNVLPERRARAALSPQQPRNGTDPLSAPSAKTRLGGALPRGPKDPRGAERAITRREREGTRTGTRKDITGTVQTPPPPLPGTEW